jgi:hypothetical protein
MGEKELCWVVVDGRETNVGLSAVYDVMLSILEKRMNEKILKGWEPFGAPILSSDPKYWGPFPCPQLRLAMYRLKAVVTT